MTLGKQTFGLTKKDFDDTLSRIINNHRVNAKVIGNPKEFVLRACNLCPAWSKLASDPAVEVRLRNVEIAGGRRVKLISLERGESAQPVSKSKLLDSLYPAKEIKTSATPEEKHYNSVKASMRQAISSQLKDYRESVQFPTLCYISNKELKKGYRTDVDHVGASFSEIADNFIEDMGLTYCEVILSGPPTAKKFKDTALWEDWKEYHKESACLSLVCASANRSKGAGDYSTPEHLYGSFGKKTPEEIGLDF